jgi:gamma-glutamylcyclotransferase (GGCT)/AIG2-like uncharacterized protein YtfP
MRLFFYGTLLDPDVRHIVLAEEIERLTIRPAVLGGYRRVRARNGDYPVLVRRTAGRVPGELVEGLSPEGLLKLAHFEGPDYLPREEAVVVAGGGRSAAWVLVPRRRGLASGAAWDLRRWQQRHKPRMLIPLKRWMAEYGMMGRYSVDIAWPVRRILARQGSPDGQEN